MYNLSDLINVISAVTSTYSSCLILPTLVHERAKRSAVPEVFMKVHGCPKKHIPFDKQLLFCGFLLFVCLFLAINELKIQEHAKCVLIHNLK